MNMHVPQDVEADAELLNLAAVPYQIISPANNTPIVGVFQDSLLGCNLFTREKVHFTHREAMNLLMMFQRVNEYELLEKKDYVTSFDLLSQIMPPLTLKYKTKLFGDEDMKNSNNVLEIVDGKYIRGRMEKSVLGAGTKGIIQRVCNDFGNYAAADFIDDLQNIITDYMKSTAYSVGISDLIANKQTNDAIVKIITQKKTDVKTIIEQIQIGIFENNTGKTNNEEFETQVNNTLNQATSDAGKIGLKSLDKNNRFVVMVSAGSKGSELNIAQMLSCLGQQNVDGKRIPYGFDHRTLPHYSKYDDGPSARGFVESSYINGLSPQELFFHAMGGRVGLIDTAVKTSKTGYIQRRLIKGLEDLMVNYDMTIRSNKGKIIQFKYGDDNMDPIKVENQQVPFVEMSIQDIYSHYNIPDEQEKTKVLSQIMISAAMKRYKKQNVEMKEKCKYYSEMLIQSRDMIIKKIFGNKSDNIVNVPVAFSYIIGNIIGQQSINPSSVTDITPLEAFQMIEENYSNLEKIHYAPPSLLFKTLYYFYLSPKELLFVKRINRAALTILLQTISLDYKRAIVAPGEMVGIIAGQSIGEPTTQLTLNSVTFETPIVVRNQEGKIQKVQIGEFIEKHIENPKKLEYYKEKDTTYAEMNEFYEVPSANEKGETVWRRVEAVTRHPVINEDGTNTMLKVTTKGCREVVATKAKSFLQLIDGKIQAVNGKDLKVGDYLPVSKKELEFRESHYLDLREILPATEYLYGSELEKAKEVYKEAFWWKKHSGKTFVLPHKRSDSVIVLFNETVRDGRTSNKCQFIKPGFVYMKNITTTSYDIPEKIPLNYNFGYLLGAYAAEGCMTKFQVSIANNDAEYFAPIMELCKEWNLTTKIYKHENKGEQGWTSQDLRIYSTLICRILENLCGKLSHNKFISDKIVFSNKECMLGFLDAYIGGDGCVNQYKLKSGDKRGDCITASSVSYNLLLDIQILLKNLGIFSNIRIKKKPTQNNRGTLPENFQQPYNLRVSGKQGQKLAEILNMKLQYKQKQANNLLKENFKYEYDNAFLTVPNIVNGMTIFEERNGLYPDIVFDEILNIEEVSNTTNYAYDLTVEDTRNFDCYNGLAIRDTFHSAGISSKSNVTRGVPRIEEILTLSANPNNPSLTVYLKEEDQTDRQKAQTYMYMLEHTKMGEIVKYVEICFDPDDLNTLIEEDTNTMTQFRVFEDMVNECNNEASNIPTPTGSEKSKWILRMEMEPEVMLEKNITMDDIHFTLKHIYNDEISCVYSDYNADKLIFRIRMNNVVKKSKDNKKKVNPLDQTDQIYILKNFQENLLNNIIIRGVKNIKKVILRKIKDNVVEMAGTYKKQDIWVLDTIGTNLKDVLALDYIDSTRTFSNDIIEIFNVLGIEAARQIIYNEFVFVMEDAGTYINYHHLSVLCDRMTFSHKLISIYRHGINNDNIGPIAKASFEETPEMFLKAARYAELDTMRGVSANVMCGQEGLYGTNAFQVILNMEEMEKLDDAIIEQKESENEMIEKMFGLSLGDDKCSTNKLIIQNNVSNIKKEDYGDDNSYNPGF